MAETITSAEVSRDTFYAYRTDVEGPFPVSLAVFSHVSDTRPVINDSFRVTVNGEDRWGGFAAHLPENGPENLGGFVRLGEDGRKEQGEGMTIPCKATDRFPFHYLATWLDEFGATYQQELRFNGDRETFLAEHVEWVRENHDVTEYACVEVPAAGLAGFESGDTF